MSFERREWGWAEELVGRAMVWGVDEAAIALFLAQDQTKAPGSMSPRGLGKQLRNLRMSNIQFLND